ncbi:MAG: IS110 family transposase [FCB group bacterium]|nr:IS110 family transposase [FCB group bacterium]
MLFVGIDWSDKTLDYYLHDHNDEVLAQGKVEVSVKGLTEMFVNLDKHGRPEEISIAAETSHGSWIQTLLDRGYTLYPVNSNSVNEFRKAMNSQGDKTDKIDRRVIAKFLSTFHKKLTPLNPDDNDIVTLRTFCQHRLRLIEEHTAKINELLCTLKTHYPAVLELFGSLDSHITLEFLKDHPTQIQMLDLSEKKLKKWLQDHSYPSMRRFEEMAEILKQPALQVAEHLQKANVPLICYLARSLQSLSREIKEWDDNIKISLDKMPESDWIRSLPGAGNVLAPALLACLGRDPKRFDKVSKAQALMGTAPVTMQSGKSSQVRFRYGCWKFARRTMHLFADQSRRQCDWAQAFYEKQRQIGHKHHEALRSLAHKWLKILLAMKRTGSHYNESVFHESRSRYLLNQQA